LPVQTCWLEDVAPLIMGLTGAGSPAAPELGITASR
jgi:hypothetical protein